VLKPYSKLEELVKATISNFQSDHQVKQSNCFPSLTPQQKEHKYKVNGFLPTNKAHLICILCKYEYVDEADSNKTLQAKYEQDLRAYKEKMKKAKEDATKNNTTNKRINAPRLA
jgi:hypothetical protein